MRRRPGIYKRGNIYWVTYTWHGRQYFESSHSSESRDAESLLLRRKAELGLGRIAVSVSDTLTVNELLDFYIAQIESPATQKRYKLSQRVLIPLCGICRITDVDAFTFDRFKELRLKEGVSPAGVNRDLALYRAAFNFAVERRLLTHSPLDGVRLFDEEKHRKAPRVLSFAEEQRILMCCDLRLHTIVTTLLDTGLRVGIEALRLKWADIDFEDSIITVAQSKTTAGLRNLPMTPLVKSALLEWRLATNGISEYVFFNPQRPSVHIRSVKTAWHNALRMAGLPRFPIYQCRHTFATRLAASGVSDTIIDQLLGHSRRDVLRFYTARVLEYLRDAMMRLDQLRTRKTELSVASRIDGIDEPPRKGPIIVN
jgi:integrase